MTPILSIALNPAIDVSGDTNHIIPTKKIRTHNERYHAGGGGVNVARVISTLGGSPDLLYLSGGVTGTLFEDLLSRLSIKSHRITIQQATRIAYTVHELQSGFEYRFVPEGPGVDVTELQQVSDYIEQLDLPSGSFIVASGSLPRGAPDDTYYRIAQSARKKNAKFILDSSGAGLRETLAGSDVFLVKPSLNELEKLVGDKLDEDGAKHAALDLVKRGSTEYVAVSIGAQGAFLASKKGILSVPAKHVKVRSAVGAGDSFVGAMVYALANGDTIETAFHLGICAGAAAVMTEGTELCRREDVYALFKPDIKERGIDLNQQ